MSANQGLSPELQTTHTLKVRLETGKTGFVFFHGTMNELKAFEHDLYNLKIVKSLVNVGYDDNSISATSELEMEDVNNQLESWI